MTLCNIWQYVTYDHVQPQQSQSTLRFLSSATQCWMQRCVLEVHMTLYVYHPGPDYMCLVQCKHIIPCLALFTTWPTLLSSILPLQLACIQYPHHDDQAWVFLSAADLASGQIPLAQGGQNGPGPEHRQLPQRVGADCLQPRHSCPRFANQCTLCY